MFNRKVLLLNKNRSAEERAAAAGWTNVCLAQRGVNIISVVIDAPADVISALSGKLGMLDGVTSKAVYSKTSRQGTGSREGAEEKA